MDPFHRRYLNIYETSSIECGPHSTNFDFVQINRYRLAAYADYVDNDYNYDGAVDVDGASEQQFSVCLRTGSALQQQQQQKNYYKNPGGEAAVGRIVGIARAGL